MPATAHGCVRACLRSAERHTAKECPSDARPCCAAPDHAPSASSQCCEKSVHCAVRVAERGHCAASAVAHSAASAAARPRTARTMRWPAPAHLRSPCLRLAPNKAAWGGPHRPTRPCTMPRSHKDQTRQPSMYRTKSCKGLQVPRKALRKSCATASGDRGKSQPWASAGSCDSVNTTKFSQSPPHTGYCTPCMCSPIQTMTS